MRRFPFFIRYITGSALAYVSQLLSMVFCLLFASPFALASEPLAINKDSFKCLYEMTKVRHFYVDNLRGDIKDTIAVATAGQGEYPPGSVIQLVPGEAMVKHDKGANGATKDWEFFELDVSGEGTHIHRRGFVDVKNKFGGNCFACHAKARPEFDMICETGHGCDPIAITRPMIAALQKTDPRCASPEPLNEADKNALAELKQILQSRAIEAEASTTSAAASN